MPDPQIIIDQIPCLAGSNLLTALSGSRVTDSWLLDSPQGQLVLRADRPLAQRLGLDRQAEAAFLAQAHAQAMGLAPEVVFSDPGQGWLVTRYIDGAPWTAEALGSREGIETLAGVLRRVHGIEAQGKPFDPAAITARYARASGHAEASRLAREAAGLTADLYGPDSVTLCHHDAHARNLVGGCSPSLLDWEYAALGEPLMDLAVVIRYHGWTSGQALALLDAWRGGPDKVEAARLDGFCRLYDRIAALWQMVVSG